MSPEELYATAKASLERLESAAAEPREWLRFGTDLLESIMKCQAILIEKQRGVLDQVRIDALAPSLPLLRREAKDALYYLDKLTALYERTKGRLSR